MQLAREREIIDIERQYWNYMKEKNVEAALRLTADPCVVAGAQGAEQIDRRKFAEMMAAGNWQLNDFRMDDIKVRAISDDVALICYKVHEDLTVDGKPVSLDAADTSTWVRKNGGWICAAHTESIVGDPFGRDRQAIH